jgi:hypothetical protein
VSRRDIDVTLEDRGNPLRFKIREMPATRLESWLIRALIMIGPALGKTGGEPASVPEAASALLEGGLSRLEGIDFAKAKPLLDELLGCCSRVLDSGHLQQCAPETVDGYIEDVRTLFALRMEALKLNLAFFGLAPGGLTSFHGSRPGAGPASVTVSRSSPT